MGSAGVEKALARLREGGFVVIYDGDGREGEADLIFHARFADAGRIETLRKDAGGLVCLAVGKGIAEKLGLPFFTDLLKRSDTGISKIGCDRTAYGDKPAFSIPINHCDVYTGITDADRALTIRKFAGMAEKKNGIKEDFAGHFYSPGHVFLLIGRGLENRRGHTELSLELARRAGMSETMVLCEMLGKGKALSKKEAKDYADRNGFVFLEGSDIHGR